MEATAVYPPRAARFNARMVVLLTAVAVPFLWFAAVFVKQTLSGGITQGDGVLKVDLKSLGNFPFNENYGTTRDIPAKWRELDGKRVELQGYMVSGTSAGSELVRFQFVYNVAICCFGSSPLVQERVFAFVPEGRTVAYRDSTTLVKMTGILHVGVLRDRSGATQAVYSIDVESADPV